MTAFVEATMTEENKSRSLIPKKADPGFIKNLIRQLQLILRLMGDKRVSFLLKLLPVGSLVYMVAPDLFPVLDDALVLGVGSYIFIELCPPDVVEEHRRAIWGEGEQIQEAAPPKDVVEAQFSDQDETKKE
jgi:hypothetical protein